MPWQELKRFEQSCEVTLRSHRDGKKRLCWRMTIKPRDAKKLVIHAEAHEIQDAVRDGMERAIQAGLIAE